MSLLFQLSPEIITALCWTLIHSLWQGCILAMLAGGIIMFTKNAKATVRYYLLLTVFFSFPITAVITFFTALNNKGLATSEFLSSSFLLQLDTGISSEGLLRLSFEPIVGFFNRHEQTIVSCWIIICILKTIRLIQGLRHLHRLTHRDVVDVPAYWKRKVSALSLAMGVGQPIKLLESSRINVPAVVGLLKPCILVPLGFFAKLSADDVEAILLHELAHIQRKDYFVNLLQTVVEISFFFNPAILWVSSLIKAERENCCDDLAVTHLKSNKQFIQALLQFHEVHSLPYAMPFMGSSMSLLSRVNRISRKRNQGLSRAENLLLAVCFIAVTVLAVSYVKSSAPRSQKAGVISFQETTNRDIAGLNRKEKGYSLMKTQNAHQKDQKQNNSKETKKLLFQKEKTRKPDAAKSISYLHNPSETKQEREDEITPPQVIVSSKAPIPAFPGLHELNDKNSFPDDAQKTDIEKMKGMASDAKNQSEKMKQQHLIMKQVHDQMKYLRAPVAFN
jgi:beta-lactamase regulating signal transducer with metallopeptidase domain